MLGTVLVAAGLVWGGLVTALWLLQDRLIFLPTRAVAATPQRVGLPYEDVSLALENGERVAGWFVPARAPRRGTLLFCHGNAGNVGDRLDSISTFVGFGLDVLIFDYEGYGASTGRPSEEAFVRDARAVWRHLVDDRAIPPREIVVFGRSLGGGAATALAAEVDCAGLAIESTFTSVADLAAELYPSWLVPRRLVRHRFENAERIRRFVRPLLIAHSPDDELVPFRHAERLFEVAGSPEKEFLRLAGGHNDGPFVTGFAYEAAYRRFLDVALGRP